MDYQEICLVLEEGGYFVRTVPKEFGDSVLKSYFISKKGVDTFSCDGPHPVALAGIPGNGFPIQVPLSDTEHSVNAQLELCKFLFEKGVPFECSSESARERLKSNLQAVLDAEGELRPLTASK